MRTFPSLKKLLLALLVQENFLAVDCVKVFVCYTGQPFNRLSFTLFSISVDKGTFAGFQNAH